MRAYNPHTPGTPMNMSHTRPFFVIDDLSQLAGPTTGTVTLPLHIQWSGNNSYELSNPVRIKTMYRTVLNEARSTTDLQTFLNKDLLIKLWPELIIPDYIRNVWQENHHELEIPS